MNWHLIIGLVVTAALAVSSQLPAPWNGIVSTVAGLIGTYVVRPSQVSGALGKAVAKMPGVGGTTDEEKQAEKEPTLFPPPAQ